MTTTVEQELQEYFTQLTSAEQSSFLQLIKTIVTEKTQKQETISLAQYNSEIDEAVTDIEKGDVYSHEEVVKMSKDW